MIRQAATPHYLRTTVPGVLGQYPYFCALIEKLLTSSGPHAAFSGLVVTLSNSAGWLCTGTGLTLVIALLRGLHAQVRTLILALRS